MGGWSVIEAFIHYLAIQCKRRPLMLRAACREGLGGMYQASAVLPRGNISYNLSKKCSTSQIHQERTNASDVQDGTPPPRPLSSRRAIVGVRAARYGSL